MSTSAVHDEEQERLMEEVCIVIDEQDKVLGMGSKRKCHLVTNIKAGLLHRAFSVFLFNTQGQLLLQQRAAAKITFPLCWTNTCCSHPLHIQNELEEQAQLGVKRAAQRKLEHELGIPHGTIGIDEFVFLTRIHYVALSDPVWGEHEIDYILFVQKDVPFVMNPNEICATRYVDAEQLRAHVAECRATNVPISPWFDLIAERFLFPWWAQLDAIMARRGLGDEAVAGAIHKLNAVPSSSSAAAGEEALAAEAEGAVSQ